MTDPALTADTPMASMTPAQLARYALRQWMTGADRIHELHTERDTRQSDMDVPGQRVVRPATEQRVADETYRMQLRATQGLMAFWLQIAQTASDVARLPDDGHDELEPSTLSGYDLAAAARWFEDMARQGEGSEPVTSRAALRWRVMSPDQRAACRTLVEEMLIFGGVAWPK